MRALQQRLQTTGFTPGPADGRYGPLTTHAVSRYQHAHTLPATGIATPRTLDALHIPTSTPTLTPPPPPRHAARSTAPHHPHRRQAHRRSTRRQTTAAARTSPGSSEPPAGPPLTPILLGLLAIGAATITASYHHTRTQTRTRTRTQPRLRPTPEQPPPPQPRARRLTPHPASPTRQPRQPR